MYSQDGVEDYLQQGTGNLGRPTHSGDGPTVSMTITINNVDQELCGHFFWDLAHKALRDNFKFDFNAASFNRARRIAVDEFQAHHNIVLSAFKYLGGGQEDQTEDIGTYLVSWLPHHLGRLRQLEDENRGELNPGERFEIGHNLHMIFKHEQVIQRHKDAFEQTFWWVEEIEMVQKWLMDSSVVRKLDSSWRDDVQRATGPTEGFLRGLVNLVVQGFLRDRTWEAQNALNWSGEFIGTVSPCRESSAIRLLSHTGHLTSLYGINLNVL